MADPPATETTGEPGIFLDGRGAVMVYRALLYLRITTQQVGRRPRGAWGCDTTDNAAYPS